MKCHYEVLGLEINCTTDELKKAYRKLALEWHPDKNLDRLEEAKETFQCIQQAYDILIDPQERAWYDRHRDDILKGGAEKAYKDECVNVYQYFNSSCFKGYNDSEKGFYTIYREVFENIAAEDRPFIDDDEVVEIPQFGFSHSSYDEVVHSFYAYWQSYCTFKTYSWTDKFDLTEARKSGVGRQMLRLMEKENKKLRDQQKKLRNEEIRELVAFVRKRDKRVQAHKKLLEEQKIEKAKKLQELRRKQVQERNKDLENYKESEWTSMSQFEHHFNEIEATLDNTFGNNCDDDDDNDDPEDYLELYCAACEKDFRSQKSMENHQNSKKHKANVAALKELMEEEDIQNNKIDDENSLDSDDNINLSNEEDISSATLLEDLIELVKSSTKSKKKKKKKAEKKKEDLTNEEKTTEDVHIDDDSTDKKESDSITKPTMIENSSTSTIKSSTKKKSKKDKTPKNTASTTAQTTEESSDKPCTLCEVCNTNFSSRNKLFDHLKESGHAVYKNETSKCTSKKQKKKNYS